MSTSKTATLNGRKTASKDLNTDSPKLLNGRVGLLSKIGSVYRKVSEILAGMYTGVGCSGTAHEFHSYEEETHSSGHSPSSDTDKK